MFRCVKPFVTLFSRYRVGDEVNPEHFEDAQQFANMMALGHIQHLSGEGDEDDHKPDEQPPAEQPVPAQQPVVVPADAPAEQPVPVQPPAPNAPPDATATIPLTPEQQAALASAFAAHQGAAPPA